MHACATPPVIANCVFVVVTLLGAGCHWQSLVPGSIWTHLALPNCMI